LRFVATFEWLRLWLDNALRPHFSHILDINNKSTKSLPLRQAGKAQNPKQILKSKNCFVFHACFVLCTLRFEFL
jgi:hypothetical protein